MLLYLGPTPCAVLGAWFRDDKVIDSRQSRDSSSIRRRRVCLQCAYRFTTYEQIERSDLRVIKRDRTHEPFDRRKLVNSLAKACEKRSISLVTLESAVDEIVHELETSGREVSSQLIGTKVLEKLREIDEVAYLRYASVHRRFEEVDEFVDAIQALGRRIKPNALQPELFGTELAQSALHAPETTSAERKVETHGGVWHVVICLFAGRSGAALRV